MTGCERVLARLQQGPATAAELYDLGVIAHSRVAELRKHGHVIRCERTRDENNAQSYTYRLLDGAATDSLVVGGHTGTIAAPSSSRAHDPGHGVTRDAWTGPSYPDETPRGTDALCCSQLSFEDAA